MIKTAWLPGQCFSSGGDSGSIYIQAYKRLLVEESETVTRLIEGLKANPNLLGSLEVVQKPSAKKYKADSSLPSSLPATTFVKTGKNYDTNGGN